MMMLNLRQVKLIRTCKSMNEWVTEKCERVVKSLLTSSIGLIRIGRSMKHLTINSAVPDSRASTMWTKRTEKSSFKMYLRRSLRVRFGRTPFLGMRL
jgi:hypothetical protein